MKTMMAVAAFALANAFSSCATGCGRQVLELRGYRKRKPDQPVSDGGYMADLTPDVLWLCACTRQSLRPPDEDNWLARSIKV
jgi:hypothetical protein